MKNLISMIEFIFLFGKEENRYNYEEAYDKITAYARFLTQPLELWMFVPCKLVEGVWMVLEEPKWDDYKQFPDYIFQHDIQKYEDAKEKCLFEGITIEKDMYHQTKRTFYILEKIRIGLFLEYYSGESEFKFQLLDDYSVIEDLVKYNLKLTKTAIKQIGI